MNLSLVIPIYNGENNILFVYERLKKTLEKLNLEYEIIYVDDGSSDATFPILKKLKEDDNSLKIIKLYKNYGQHPALAVGFNYLSGDMVITMDNDLEIDPDYIPKFLDKLNEGYSLVNGVRIDRKTQILRKIFTFIFYKIISYLTKVKLHDFGCPLKAFKKELVKEIIKYGTIIEFISKLNKYKIAEININNCKKEKSTYNLIGLFKLAFFVFKNILNPPKIKEGNFKEMVEKIL